MTHILNAWNRDRLLNCTCSVSGCKLSDGGFHFMDKGPKAPELKCPGWQLVSFGAEMDPRAWTPALRALGMSTLCLHKVRGQGAVRVQSVGMPGHRGEGKVRGQGAIRVRGSQARGKGPKTQEGHMQLQKPGFNSFSPSVTNFLGSTNFSLPSSPPCLSSCTD